MTRNDVKNEMWGFLMEGGQKSNVPALKEAVGQLIKATTQNTAGQRKGKTDVNWDDLWMIQQEIIMEATALVLSGDLDELEKDLERSE